MEDLDAPIVRQLHLLQDPAVAQRLDGRRNVRGQLARNLLEVGDRVRDLAAGGCHQPVEEARAELALLGAHRREHLLEVPPDDARCTVELEVRVESQDARAVAGGVGPQALEHELEKRGLDAVVDVRGGAALLFVVAPEQDPLRRADTDVPQQLGDELVLDLRLLAALFVPDAQRPANRLLGVLLRQVREAERVSEQPRDALAEAVQRRERVLPQRHQERGLDVAPVDRASELGFEGRAAVLGSRVVDEVLLELVEDDEHRSPECLGRLRDQLVERQRLVEYDRTVGLLRNGLDELPLQRREEPGTLPLAEDDNHGVPALADPRDEPGEQDRALADAGGAVEDAEPRRVEVRLDHTLVALTAEEVLALLLRERP